MKSIKIAIITGSRAEFGIMTNLLGLLRDSEQFILQLIVTGSHLSPSLGNTKDEISSLFKIDKEVEILLSSNSRVGVAKSMGLACISLSEVLHELDPDLLLVLGDRFEIHAASSVAVILGIPIVHLYGGELTEGAWDESLRHSITKLSNIHFTSTESYRNRVIQLGENPNSVFNVGALGVENIKNRTLISKKALEKELNFSIDRKTILVTMHSETNNMKNESSSISYLLRALEDIDNIKIVFTLSNADAGGEEINQQIKAFVKQHSKRSVVFDSLGQTRYFSLLQYVGLVVGNSSSGIIEVPSFGIKTLNIGNRQDGRTRADSVIDCKANYDEIYKNLQSFNQEEFKKLDTKNPFEKAGTAQRIVDILSNIVPEELCNKEFYDLH